MSFCAPSIQELNKVVAYSTNFLKKHNDLQALKTDLVDKTTKEAGSKELGQYYAQYIENHYQDLQDRIQGGIEMDQNSPAYKEVLGTVKHTQKEIDWFNNNPISSYIPLNIISDIVNSDKWSS